MAVKYYKSGGKYYKYPTQSYHGSRKSPVLTQAERKRRSDQARQNFGLAKVTSYPGVGPGSRKRPKRYQYRQRYYNKPGVNRSVVDRPLGGDFPDTLLPRKMNPTRGASAAHMGIGGVGLMFPGSFVVP